MTQRLDELSWEQAAERLQGAIGVLPIGATEAHGPHLPLGTDVVIARAMAREGARRLEEAGHRVVVLPDLAYTVAPFAKGFSSTVSLRPATLTALLVDIGQGLAEHGLAMLVLANAHLDPAHILAIRAAAVQLQDALTVVFPDVTRRPWAQLLTAEFKTGACHAGCYESSIVLAERPDLVDDALRTALPANPASLSVAIREGKSSFEAAGGPRAYFGWPADASVEEGRQTIDVLGRIVRDAVNEALAGENA